MCNELCEVGLRERDKRNEEIASLETAVNEGEENIQNESRK